MPSQERFRASELGKDEYAHRQHIQWPRFGLFKT